MALWTLSLLFWAKTTQALVGLQIPCAPWSLYFQKHLCETQIRFLGLLHSLTHQFFMSLLQWSWFSFSKLGYIALPFFHLTHPSFLPFFLLPSFFPSFLLLPSPFLPFLFFFSFFLFFPSFLPFSSLFFEIRCFIARSSNNPTSSRSPTVPAFFTDTISLASCRLSIMQMKKLKFREIKWLAQGHTASYNFRFLILYLIYLWKQNPEGPLFLIDSWKEIA